MTDKKVISFILLPMLALTLVLGLLVLNSPIRAAAGVSAPAQAGLSAWNPLHTSLATTPGVNGLMPVASALAEPAAVCIPDVTSMLSYWPLDEDSGTAFADVVDGNPGACTDPNCPAPVAGKVSGAQQFTANQLDGIVITESTDEDQKLNWANGDSFSFEMWVNFTETCEGNKVFFGRYRGVVGESQWWVGCTMVDTTGGYPVFNLRDDQTAGPPTTVQIVGPTAINDGAWHHVVAVRDAGAATNRLYVDGSEATNTATSYIGGFASTGVISMGFYANSYYFDGMLDEIAVYNKALSEAEISNHYNDGNGQSYCNDAPTAVDDDLTTDEDTDLDFTGDDLLVNDTDPDGDLLTIGAIDSTSAEGGTISDLGSGNYRYSPPAEFAGSDTFGYTASDGNGNTDTATVTVTVGAVNDPPVADDQAVSTDEDVAVDITLTATDQEGDPLTYSVVDYPVNGDLSGTAPNLTYTPDGDYYGADSFTFKANDGFLDSNTATVSITVDPVEDPPIAVDDALTTDEDMDKNFTEAELLANDQEPDGDPLTFTVDTSSAEGGTITDLGSGNYVYAPPADFNGTDTFSYSISDGNGGTDTGTVVVTVNPVNDVPVADDQAVSTAFETAIAITLTATDVDGDPLTFAVVDPPVNGTLSGIAPDLTYTPASGFSGQDSFTFNVYDGTEYSLEATVTITVAPDTGPKWLFLPLVVKASE